MKTNIRKLRNILLAVIASTTIGNISAQNLYWNEAQKTLTNWVSDHWYPAPEGGTLQSWNSGDNAVFFSDGLATGNYSISLSSDSPVVGSITKRSGGGQLAINGNSSRALTITTGIIKVDAGILLFNANILGTNGLTKQGSGILNLNHSGNSLVKGYSGTTVISEGVLRLLNAVLPVTSDLEMQGGTLGFSDGAVSTMTQDTGALIVSLDSVIDFGNLSGGVTLSVDGGLWSSGVLTISNWTEGTDFFLTTQTLGTNLLQAIHFEGYDEPGAQLVTHGDVFAIIPVPEPSAMFLMTAGVFWMLCRRGRRKAV